MKSYIDYTNERAREANRADGGANIKTKHENIQAGTGDVPIAHGPAPVDLAEIKAQLDVIDRKLDQLILRSGLR